MSSVADLTRDLVSIPSHDDETAAGDFIEEWLRAETDADVRRDGVGNVIARYGDSDELALVGHHDVVPPDEIQLSDGAYVLETTENRLYARGAADMKGAVAASMLAFRKTPREGLVFASFVGEELGGIGARHAIDEGFSPEYAVVGEGSTGYATPGVTDVVVAHKGRRASTITAHGTAVHASEPESGENAVYRACDAVAHVRAIDPPSTTVLDERVAGTLAVTGIDGGSAWNVIPESCAITVDERTIPGERAPLETVEAIEGIEWTIDQDLPPMACDDEKFAEMVQEIADECQDGTPELVTKPAATDGGWLAAAGVTCVVCGPSELGEAHTKDESVSLDVLDRCYRIYAELADAVGGDS